MLNAIIDFKMAMQDAMKNWIENEFPKHCECPFPCKNRWQTRTALPCTMCLRNPLIERDTFLNPERSGDYFEECKSKKGVSK